jgi:4-oxalocrotonate tautomerase
MPYINVKVAGSLTLEQKKTIADKFSNVLHEVAGKKPSSTYIVFEEVGRDSWAVGGRLLSDKDE